MNKVCLERRLTQWVGLWPSSRFSAVIGTCAETRYAWTVYPYSVWINWYGTQTGVNTKKHIKRVFVDLTASFIASLISGSDFILVTPPLGDSLQVFRENVNFIRKTLSKAQISCSSLICSLWYIDQYFHQPDIIKKGCWNPRDLFIASIVVADKYL